jgi:hypothetical protein
MLSSIAHLDDEHIRLPVLRINKQSIQAVNHLMRILVWKRGGKLWHGNKQLMLSGLQMPNKISGHGDCTTEFQQDNLQEAPPAC